MYSHNTSYNKFDNHLYLGELNHIIYSLMYPCVVPGSSLVAFGDIHENNFADRNQCKLSCPPYCKTQGLLVYVCCFPMHRWGSYLGVNNADSSVLNLWLMHIYMTWYEIINAGILLIVFVIFVIKYYFYYQVGRKKIQ